MWLIETTNWLEERTYVMGARQDLAHDEDGSRKAEWENHKEIPFGTQDQVREG